MPQYNTLHLWSSILDDFDRIMSAFVLPTYANQVGFKPSCDINETKQHYLVSFDIPGIRKEDIKIEVQGNQLVISGERHRLMQGDASETTLRHERAYGKFERTFVLPSSIDADRIEALYENGVLNVALQIRK